MTVPVPKTWANNEMPDWEEYKKELFDVITFLLNPPMVHVFTTASVTLTNNLQTSIPFNTVVVDTEQMWDAAVPTRITPKTPGRYKMIYGGSFLAGNLAGRRIVVPTKNGIQVAQGRRDDRHGDSGSAHKVMQGLVSYVSVNGTTDYITLDLYQDSGVNTSTDNTQIGYYPRMYMRWVGPW